MRNLLGRLRRSGSRSLVEQLATLTSVGDGSTLTLDFTTGVLDPRLTFTRDGGGTYIGNDGRVYGMDFATSSSLAIGTGSKSVTLTATAGVDRRYLVGQTVWISNGANNMRGPVTAYNASTQVLTIDATGTSGSGSFTSWTVGNASPRFDYDPTSIGTPRGLLIEGSAVNLALRSNDFNTTVNDGSQWVFGGYTVAATSTTLPDGTTGNTLRISTASASGSVRSSTLTVSQNTTYTWSFWARNNGGSQARFRVWNVTAGSSIVDYTQSANNYVSQIGGANNTSSTWVRVSVTFTTPAGCTAIYVYPTSSDSGTVDLFVWGAQVELGSGASSYIPTGASQGTRNPDYCVMDGISSFFTSQSSLTMLIDATPRFQSGFPALWRLTDAGNANSYELYYTSSGTNNTYATKVTVGGVSSGESNFANSIAQDTRQIMGYAIASGVGFRSRNGASATAQIPTSLPSAALTRLGVGSSGLSANPSTAHIRRIKYWPYAMTQDQLNGVTTP